MTIEMITQDFRNGVSEAVRLSQEGVDRFRVFTPFRFEDGDHLVIVLKREGNGWVLSDEAHTFMHLADDLDEGELRGDTCHPIIASALARFCIEDRDGELIRPVADERYANALFGFAQGLLTVAAIAYVARARVPAVLPDISSAAD